MLDSYTGIYTTRDQLTARRVLSAITNDEGKHPSFLFKDGFYEVIFPGILPEDKAHDLNRYAHTVADTNLIPLPLCTFTQEEI